MRQRAGFRVDLMEDQWADQRKNLKKQKRMTIRKPNLTIREKTGIRLKGKNQFGAGYEGSFLKRKSRRSLHIMNMNGKKTIIKENNAGDETVFIPWTENCENKLYGSGKGNKYHIDLVKTPLTVGKMTGAVDMVIPDGSLSRMHAKFIRTQNRYYMVDLNSTNGCFINGRRLAPNEQVQIEAGDEIGLGKLKFIYR